MKKNILLLFAALLLFSSVGCNKQENAPVASSAPEVLNPAGSEQPSYNENAQPGDEGVIQTEEGNLIVPSTSEKYGNSHGNLRVTTPNNNGNFDIITYNFPSATLESVTYEMHFANEEQAKRVYDDHTNVNVTDLKIEGSVVTYTTTDSNWIGLKKRDVLDNASKIWEQLGYTVENQ